jgi:hypothetical protein
MYLVPTPLRDDSFSLIAPVGAPRQYLIDLDALDHDISYYDVQISQWRTMTRETRQASGQLLEQGYSNFDRRLETQTWPAGVERFVDLLVQRDHRIETDVRSWQTSGPTHDAPEFSTTVPDESRQLDELLRARLGLPPAWSNQVDTRRGTQVSSADVFDYGQW